ncbi:Retrovirus-related Pol polyprotein from transposon RE1, partial [Linum perenne]
MLDLTSCKLVTGKTLLRGDGHNGLYLLPSLPPTKPSAMALSGVRTTLNGWHRRLGHPHESLLRRLVSSFGLPISSNKFSSPCESCQLGKSHRFHLPISHMKSLHPFDLVYSCQLGKSHRFQVVILCCFMDDCTRFVWIYFMT